MDLIGLFNNNIISVISHDSHKHINGIMQSYQIVLMKNDYLDCYTVILKIDQTSNSFDFDSLELAIKKYLILVDFFS